MNKMHKPAQTEQEFLLSLAVGQYNRQFSKRTKIEEYDIRSIKPRVGYRLGYEISTKIDHDYVRMRIYLNLGDSDVVSTYLMRVEEGFLSKENLEDEVLVAFGTVDRWYVTERVYRFSPIKNSELSDPFIFLEDGTRLLLENGESFELE